MILACHARYAGSIPAGIVAQYVHIVHLLTITMQSAFDTIIDTYDYETCKEIVSNGCQSGVCTEHIYNGDTIKFFDTHTDEVTEFIIDVLGIEALSETLKKNDGDLDMYKNDLTWSFIELVAMHVVDDYEDAVTDLEELAGNYMQEEISNYGYTASDLVNA